MENNEKQRKFLSGMSGAFQKATDLSKKAVDEIQKGAKALSEKTQNDSYERRMKKYNPLFPKDIKAESFRLPDIIQIVDDVARRDIDVCEGAIGWTSIEKETEVLYLYKDFTSEFNISFIPNEECNAIYYIDRFDSGKYIRVDCIFSRTLDEKLAELKTIAHLLGAKRCTIEMENNSASKSRFSIAIGAGDNKGRMEQGESRGSGDRRRGRIVAEFEGNDTPKRPKLKWFAHDDNINRLIEMRCTSRNSIKSETLELEGASTATMSKKTACAIGSVGKVGLKSSVNVERKAEEEQHSKLIFNIEF